MYGNDIVKLGTDISFTANIVVIPP